MPIQTPIIDDRAYHKIVAQTQDLLKQYAGWQPRTAGQPGVGEALVGIFAHMAEQVIERLNQAPERNFLAFLEMIGARRLPPHPARVPLTFELAEGVQEKVVNVPAGTQAAPTADPNVIFETDDELTVHRAQLKALLVHEPTTDLYADYSSLLPMVTPSSFPAFAGKDAVEHCLYLACEPFFASPATKTVSLTFTSTAVDRLRKLNIAWFSGEGETMVKLAPTPSRQGNQWKVTFEKLPALPVYTVSGEARAWLRARLLESITPDWKSPIITQVRATVKIEHEEPVAKLIAFADSQRLDLSKAFYPFSEKPRYGAAFYLAVPVVFERGKNTVTLDITLSDTATVIPHDLRIAWEAWSNQRWQPVIDIVTKLTENAPKDATSLSVEKTDALSANDDLLLDQGTENSEICQIDKVDGNKIELKKGLEKAHRKDALVSIRVTEDFTASRPVTLRLPDPMTKTVVNGEHGYWLRARIDAGDYGKEAHYDFKQDGTIAAYTQATFAPPVVKALTLTYSYEKSDLPVTWKTRNNFKFAGPPTAAPGNDNAFTPFKASGETAPALYLGFDEPLPNRAIALYWNVAPQVAGPTASKPPTLEWQYACPGHERWKKLPLLSDETKNFTRRGLITFIGPSDIEQRPEFDRNLYWLRVIYTTDPPVAMPAVVRVLTNTVWASQARTIRNEILGSGTGEADQTLSTTKAPVLEHPQIEVRELAMPNADDLKTLQQEEGDDAIPRSEAGEFWVRWHEVPDFYGSGPRSRHYRCDHFTGQVQFGDGRYGMAPPLGRNNVQAPRYRTGGGKQGNQPAHTITQLKTTIPFVDRVINHEAAEGGADAEPLDGVKTRGPKLLRHRDRAVALADFEDLAYEASPDVARACAIDEGSGKVTVVIVARRAEAKPAPTLALCEDVTAYLHQRCAPAAQLQVCGPDWVEVKVIVTVVPTSAQAANTLEATVRSALQRFLHPLTGGLDQQGWTFGRQPYESDLYALIEALAGVDHVSKLEMMLSIKDASGKQEMIPLAKDAELSKRSMIFSGDHVVTVATPG